MSDIKAEPSIIDDELLRAFHSREACPECGGTALVFSEDNTQDLESCPSCERLMMLLPDTGLSGGKDPSNVVRVLVDPITKKIGTIPF